MKLQDAFGAGKLKRSDLIAGFTGALVYIPKGIGYALVAGLAPIHGLAAGIVPPIVGSLATGSSLMSVVATNELAVPAGVILAGLAPENIVATICTMTVLMGLVQLLFGVLRLGSILRFISESVMTGFLTGVAALLILGQLSNLTGFSGSASGNIVVRAYDWAAGIERWDLPTTVVGLVCIAAILLLNRTRVRQFALVGGIAVAAATAYVWGSPSIALLAQLPSGFPAPLLPDIADVPGLIVPALSLAIVGLSVAAAATQSYPEPDGALPRNSRDFAGQGIANIVGGVFQSMPAGGSLSNTALLVSAGARSRLANFSSGIFLLIIVLTMKGIIQMIPIGALAGLLVVIGFKMIKPARILRVRGTHWSERIAMWVTFLLVLIIPLQYAILSGVVITIALYVYSSSVSIRLFQLARRVDGRYEELPAPAVLTANGITILGMSGNSFFAAVYELERSMPALEEAENAVVIWSMRERDQVSSGLLAMLERQAAKLSAKGGKLLLAGVEPGVLGELERSGTLRMIGPENVFPATAIFGEALDTAYDAGRAWIERSEPGLPDHAET